MTVPRKRKKLAETAETLKKKIPDQHPKMKVGKAERTSSPHSAKKIDNAFKIMKHIEEDDSSEDMASERKGSVRERKPDSPSFQPKRQGFRFRISLDALIPNKKSLDDDEEDRKSSRISRAPLLDIGVTIPFLWRFPIIGEIAQKVVRNIKTIKL